MRTTLALFLALCAAWTSSDKPDELVLPLKPGLLEDPQRVPFPLALPLTPGEPPRALVATQQALARALEEFPLRLDDEVLLVPVGASRRPLKLKQGRSAVVEIAWRERAVPVLFWGDHGRWYAAPAALLTGRSKGHRLELLDTGLDGEFDDPLDMLAWDDGAWRVLEKEPLVPDFDGLRSLRLEEVRRGLEARLLLEPLPDGTDEDARRSWRTVNALRNSVALGPVRLSLERCAAADAHAAYLQRNAPNGSRGFNVHDEDPALPGYTEAGDRAAGGNVGWASGGRDLGAQPTYEFATLFHRGEFLYPSPDMGAGQDGGYAVTWVEDSQPDLARWLKDTGQDSHWVMVPAPGQSAVPPRALRDSPVPASVPDFYTRSRGWPVSVSTSYGYSDFEDAVLRVYDQDDEEVEGFLFTLADAGFSSPGFPADWIWAAKTQFSSGVTYRASFRATLKPRVSGREARELGFDWTFSTGR
jgi:hypothetical protein